MNPFLASIMLFAGNFAPRGWAFCNGQILAISQNTALFSLLGTTFGGNGITTFALPDLRGRVPVHAGQGPGLSNYNLGQIGGTEQVTLNVNQTPVHNHNIEVNTSLASNPAPLNNFLAAGSFAGDPLKNYAASATASSFLNSASVTSAGGNQPHDNTQPYLAINYCIALEGIFPSRN